MARCTSCQGSGQDGAVPCVWCLGSGEAVPDDEPCLTALPPGWCVIYGGRAYDPQSPASPRRPRRFAVYQGGKVRPRPAAPPKPPSAGERAGARDLARRGDLPPGYR